MSLHMQMIVSILKAFSDSNGLKMPSADVLDGIAHDLDEEYAKIMLASFPKRIDTYLRVSEDLHQDWVDLPLAAAECAQPPA